MGEINTKNVEVLFWLIVWQSNWYISLEVVTVDTKLRMYDVAVSGCPEEFAYIESHNLCYRMVEHSLQWQSASLYCRAMDSRAHLLVISNEEEQQFINEALSEMPCKYVKSASTKTTVNTEHTMYFNKFWKLLWKPKEIGSLLWKTWEKIRQTSFIK